MSDRPHNKACILNLILAHTLFVVSLFSSPAVWAAAVSNPTPEGLLPHFESWIALLLIFCIWYSMVTESSITKNSRQRQIVGSNRLLRRCLVLRTVNVKAARYW